VKRQRGGSQREPGEDDRPSLPISNQKLPTSVTGTNEDWIIVSYAGRLADSGGSRAVVPGIHASIEIHPAMAPADLAKATGIEDAVKQVHVTKNQKHERAWDGQAHFRRDYLNSNCLPPGVLCYTLVSCEAAWGGGLWTAIAGSRLPRVPTGIRGR